MFCGLSHLFIRVTTLNVRDCEMTTNYRMCLMKCLELFLTLKLLAPTTVGARINPYPANVEKMVSS